MAYGTIDTVDALEFDVPGNTMVSFSYVVPFPTNTLELGEIAVVLRIKDPAVFVVPKSIPGPPIF